MADFLQFAFVAADSPGPKEAAARLAALYGQNDIAHASVIVALGGDGFMLQTLRETMKSGKRIYGMNRGTVGFLMNEYAEDNLRERVAAAEAETIRPLEMSAVDTAGVVTTALAINEVSLFRQSYQAAKLRIDVDGRERLDDLICDGVMVATPAGSTAYNLSAHGPILPNRSVVRFAVLEQEKRPVNAVADNAEVKSVVSVTVREAPDTTATMLFDASHSWDERILAEQFRY